VRSPLCEAPFRVSVRLRYLGPQQADPKGGCTQPALRSPDVAVATVQVLKEAGLFRLFGNWQTEMFVCAPGGRAAARRPIEKSQLQ